MESSAIQSMDITSIKAVLSDLRRNILPSRFEKAQQPDPNTIQLGFRNLNALNWLEISWEAESARIVQIDSPKKIGGESTLARQINHGIHKMVLTSLNQKGFERVIKLNFCYRPGEPIKKTLIVEIMGRHSNILLVDEEGKIITLGRQIRENQSRIRPLSTGSIYIPPPRMSGKEPDLKEKYDKWKGNLCLIPKSFKKALQESYQGISPSHVNRLLDLKEKGFRVNSETNVALINEEDWQVIFKRWNNWLATIKEEDYQLSFDGTNNFSVWGDFSQSSKSEPIALPLGEFYKEKVTLKKLYILHKKINLILDKEREIESSSLRKQRSYLKEISENDLIKKEADRLLSQPFPTKDQINKAQKLYKKYKKYIRSSKIIEERISHHKQRIINISESQSFLIDIMESKNDTIEAKLNMVNDLSQELNEYLLPRRRSKNNLVHSKNKRGLNILELKSPNGLIIQIGRNHSQNDWISIRKASKGDVWFHAQECPGSHIVLKSSTGVSEEKDLQMAADLAAFFSRARGNKSVPIVMVPTENLRRIKGAAPGTVLHNGGEIIWGDSAEGMRHFQA